MQIHPLDQIDFYKSGHFVQYPENTEVVFTNFTPRKSRIDSVNEMVFFGLQYFIKEYLIAQWDKNFFGKPKDEVVAQYKRRMENALGPGSLTYEHVAALHDLKFLPIKIHALPEGTRVPMRVAPMVFYNTLSKFYWVTNYLETILSTTLWGMCTSATTTFEYKKLLTEFADLTVGNRDFVQWQAHDFSFRGMFGFEAACMSGAAHLLSSTGTDSVHAIDFLEEYYNANSDIELIGGSVPATEHSVMCMGLQDHEFETFERLITKVYPKGIVSIVSDTWDFWQVITEYLPRLKPEILARDGKVVIRPDSGDPVLIICGDPNATPGSPEFKGAIECMWETFGGTTTAKGYKLLDSHIGLIYGDSITTERAYRILSNLEKKGFASFNVVFGVGSYTYQYVTRDTFGIAVKATYGEVNGEPKNIFKTPKTDDGTKNSAKGLLAVFRTPQGELYMKNGATWNDVNNCEYRLVFENGHLLVDDTLANIRQRLTI